MQDITIHIQEVGDGEGFLYDIYQGEPEDNMGDKKDPIGGGQSTSTAVQAISMAQHEVEELIRARIIK